MNSNFKKKLFSKILPPHALTYIAIEAFVLVIGPMVLFTFHPILSNRPGLFAAVLVTLSLFFFLFSVLTGILLLNLRSPFLEEWKHRFGLQKQS